MISATDITKSYPSRNGEITALGGVTIKVDRGQFAVITGRSGAGKSTLLGVIGGLLTPSSGEVFLDSEPLFQLNERARARVRAQKIGFVFQHASVITSLTALENVLLPQAFLPKPLTPDLPRARDLLELVGLADRAAAYPEQLSGGEKRRVAIASALMNKPLLFLADEPTGDLDEETASQIMQLFLDIRQKGTTIVMITHDQCLTSHADRIFEMDDGLIKESSDQNKTENSSS